MARAGFLVPLGEGHINPALGLAQALVRRGEAVTMYVDPAWRTRVERIGAAFSPLASLVRPDRLREAARWPGGIPWAAAEAHLLDWVTGTAEALGPRLRADGIDYLVADSAVGLLGAVVSQHLGVRHIGLCTTFAWTVGLSPLFARRGGGRNADPGAEQARAEAVARFQERWRVQPPAFPEGWMELAETVLVFTSRDFQPHGDRFGARYHFIGPCLGAREDGEPAFWQAVERAASVGGSKRPLLYVALGTLFNHRPAFWATCLKAFSDYPGPVVMAVGPHTAPEELPAVPPHVVVRPRVPQVAVLARAGVFVSHGGMNSVQEALVHGVPLLLYPLTADQPAVADRVVELGAGRRIGPDPTPEDLREGVEELVNEARYRAAAERIGASLRAAGGCERGAELVLAFERAHTWH